MLKATAIFLYFTITGLAVASEPCDYEKEVVDHWNNALKVKVSEYKRNRHREAKQNFLVCIREDEEQKELPIKSRKEKVLSKKLYTSKRKQTRHSNIQINHYSGFTGEKLRAWNNYFIEASVCLNNKSDMALFVKCGEERKQYISIFESRWDSDKKKLRLMIN